MDLGVPEYRRIRRALRGELEGGHLAPGDKLPTERELVERFGVSHMTVRQALDGLVREGLVVRRRGLGTFVANNRALTRSVNRLQSFSDDVGAGAGAVVIHQREIDPPADVSKRLEMRRAGKVVDLLRLRTINGEPAAINQVYIPVRLAPGLATAQMTDRSLYHYLEDAGVVLDRAEQRIFATAAAPWQAKLLRVQKGSPLLGSERLTRNTNNVPVEFVLSWSQPHLSVWVEMRR